MSALALAGWILAGALGLLAYELRRRLELTRRAEHELRGPLAALELGVERVRRGTAGAELASLLEAQLDRSRTGLADLVAARRGCRAAARRARVGLERLVDHSAAGWRPVAASAGRTLSVDWRADGAEVEADRGRLAQALGNLLANAIEHGDGEVEVRGWRVGDAVRIEVADAGGLVAPKRAANGGRPASGPRPATAWKGSGPAAAWKRRPRTGPAGAARGRGLRIAEQAVEECGGTLVVGLDGAGTTAAVELPVKDP